MSRFDRNMRVLATCYRISAGLVGLATVLFAFALFPPGVVFDRWDLVNRILPLTLVLMGGLFTVVLSRVATALDTRQQVTFCLVVAWLVCAFVPLGTVLGVFTVIQLNQSGRGRA